MGEAIVFVDALRSFVPSTGNNRQVVPCVRQSVPTFSQWCCAGKPLSLGLSAVAMITAVFFMKCKRPPRPNVATKRQTKEAESDDSHSIAIPADYKAAGVIFYTRVASSEGGWVAKILLGVEKRKVQLSDLGEGPGTDRREVLLFPQGKREKEDVDFVATA